MGPLKIPLNFFIYSTIKTMTAVSLLDLKLCLYAILRRVNEADIASKVVSGIFHKIKDFPFETMLGSTPKFFHN